MGKNLIKPLDLSKYRNPSVVGIDFNVDSSVIKVVFKENLSPNETTNSNLSVWRDTYGVVAGEIKIIKREWGVLVPGRVIPEQIIFPEDNKNIGLSNN